MPRGKKITQEALALRIAKEKAKMEKKIDAMKAAEQAAIAKLEAQMAELTASEKDEPMLRPSTAAPGRKISQKEEDMLLEMARQSLRQHGTILPPKEVLYLSMDAECPHCGKVGKLATEFGFKKYKNAKGEEEIKPQSWCRDCRSGKDAHPSRNRG